MYTKKELEDMIKLCGHIVSDAEKRSKEYTKRIENLTQSKQIADDEALGYRQKMKDLQIMLDEKMKGQ